jgi:hypothetical protein
MKKKTFFLKIAGIIFFAALSLFFYSCNKERFASSGCGRPVCLYEQVCSPNPSGGDPICEFQPVYCTDLLFCVDLKLPKCVAVDCGPRDFIGMFKDTIPKLIDYLKGDPEPQPNIRFIPYGVTEKIVWLQFYSPIQDVLNDTIFNLSKSITLDKQNAYLQGLKGNIIPAGNYPVVFDANTKTYNAIAIVQ